MARLRGAAPVDGVIAFEGITYNGIKHKGVTHKGVTHKGAALHHRPSDPSPKYATRKSTNTRTLADKWCLSGKTA